MAKKSNKQTQLQKEWEKQYKLLKRRASSWKKVHRILYDKLPEKPKRVTKKAVEKLKETKWKHFTEEEKRTYRNKYEEAYEERIIPDPYENDIYNPPTEYDYFNSNDFIEDSLWEDTENEPALSEEEIDAFIDETIDAILDINGIERVNENIRQIFQNLLDSLRNSLGDRGFYDFLSDPSIVDELTEAAQTGMATSPTKDTSGAEKPQAHDAIIKFTNTLNRHKPLDAYQAEQLEDVISSAGYYGGVRFEDIE